MLGIIFFLHMGVLHIQEPSVRSPGGLLGPTRWFPLSGCNMLIPLSTCVFRDPVLGRQGHETYFSFDTCMSKPSAQQMAWYSCHVAIDVVWGFSMQMLIGSSTNGNASDGHVIIPNLGYKKDTFLASNIHSSHLTKTTTPILPLECLLPHLLASCLLRSGFVQ